MDHNIGLKVGRPESWETPKAGIEKAYQLPSLIAFLLHSLIWRIL